MPRDASKPDSTPTYVGCRRSESKYRPGDGQTRAPSRTPRGPLRQRWVDGLLGIHRRRRDALRATPHALPVLADYGGGDD